MDKYQALREQQTSAPNEELTTDAIIAKLQEWDSRYGIEIGEVKHDSVVVVFVTLPEDVAALAQEIATFCPDVIDQHFEPIGELVETAEETGTELPENIQTLIEGVDFTEENYAFVLLERSLRRDRTIPLWWD
jgi:hypothetical protein